VGKRGFMKIVDANKMTWEVKVSKA